GTYNSGDGFRELLGTDVDQSTTSPAAAGAYVAAASTDDFTATDLVLPLSGGNPRFHTEIGSGGHVLSSLYEGGLLQGTGVNQSFTTGTAYLFTSAELASGVDTSSRVDGGALVGQRESFSTTKVAGTGTAQSLVGDAVFDGAYASTYQVRFVNATDYVIQTTGGVALGEAVADGTQFVAYENSMLAGSAFTFTSDAAPASGATWEFTLGLDATRSLADAGFATPATEATNGTFTINGTRITITDYTTETVENVLAKINSSGAGVVANYDRIEDRFIISATELGPDGEIDMGSVDDSSNFLAIAKLDLGALGSEATQTVGVENQEIDTSATLSDAGFSTAISGGTFTINGVKLYVDPSQDSMDDLIERINESAAHVIAKYDATGDRLILENDMEDPATSSNTIKVRVGSPTDTSNFLGAVRLVTPGEMGFQRQVGEAGEDASFTVDGITYSRTTNSVDDVITGVTLDLRGTSDGIVTLDVEVDTDRGKEAIAEWIAEWNDIVLTMNPEPLTDEEERYLEPLSDSDRANMTFAEIEEYEALNRQYRIQELIRTDSSMRRIFYQMRNIITEPVDGLPNPLDALVDLGIDVYTPLNTIVPTGQLVLDSTDEEEILEKLNDNFELTKALREDEEGITKLFGNEQYEGSGSFVNTQLEFSGDTFTMPSAGGDLKFQVGDGTSWSGTITLEEGRTYTREELLDILDQAGLRVPTDDDYPQDRANVRVSYSGPNTLAFSILNFSTGASVWFRDLSEGTNDVSTILGVDLNEADPGIAEALHALVGDAISSTGVLGARTRVGGSLDRQIQSLQSQITDWQRRVALKEYYLNQQFSRFEAQLAEIQQMGQAVTNLSNMLAGSGAAQGQGQQ
ncbi:MAG: flagellar filament capping protein FliD, partial [Armatimonadia bacterium]|nr:flagellar filament capping protein FliD [Armatimonadia bacterium]